MKTSFLLLIAIFLNTTLLLAEPVSLLVQGVNPLILVIVEAFLVFGYLANKWIKEFRDACELELGDLNLFVFKSPKD